MWGYVIAAAELGLVHDLRELQALPTEDRVDQPIIHYCADDEHESDGWSWGKRGYRAWEPVPDPPDGTPGGSVALVALLNECARTRQWCLER